jgi:hypothetical protein
MSRLDHVHVFRRIPPKCRRQASFRPRPCIQAKHGDIAAEARCLQSACTRMLISTLPCIALPDAREEVRRQIDLLRRHGETVVAEARDLCTLANELGIPMRLSRGARSGRPDAKATRPSRACWPSTASRASRALTLPEGGCTFAFRAATGFLSDGGPHA